MRKWAQWFIMYTCLSEAMHDDVIKWKHFIPRQWPFVKPFARESTGDRWIPLTKNSDAEPWSFLLCHTMDLLWEKFLWILPLYMKPISFQSKASVVCSVTAAIFMDCCPKKLNVFSQHIGKKTNEYLTFGEQIPRNWNVDQLSMLITSWDITQWCSINLLWKELMECMSEHTSLISPYQLLITAVCTNTGGKMKGSHPRAADRCPFVHRHS